MAFEFPVVFIVLLFSLLLPLADVAIAGFEYISSRAALRGYGQYLQYHPPPDVTAWSGSTWQSSLPTTNAGYTISGLSVLCGDANTVCSSSNTASPKYFSFATSLTLSPMVLSAILCSTSCTYTFHYSERFQ